MALKEKSPPSAATEERGTSGDLGDRKTLTARLAKYASQKRVSAQIGASLRDVISVPKLGWKVLSCGRYLAFRKFLETGKADLLCGNFCNQHLLCVACASARATRLRAKWEPVIESFPDTDLYMLTLTWPPPMDPLAASAGTVSEIKGNIAVGTSGWGKLWVRRKNRRKGPLSRVLGAIVSLEVTRGPAGWHPHFHSVVMLPKGERIDVVDLRREWTKYTGGRQIRIDRIRSSRDLREVFKYAVKPCELLENGHVDQSAIQDRYDIFRALRGSRLIKGYGSFYGIKDIHDLNAEEELTDGDLGEYIDLFFRWSGDQYQQVSGAGLEIKNGKVKRGKYAVL